MVQSWCKPVVRVTKVTLWKHGARMAYPRSKHANMASTLKRHGGNIETQRTPGVNVVKLGNHWVDRETWCKRGANTLFGDGNMTDVRIWKYRGANMET